MLLKVIYKIGSFFFNKGFLKIAFYSNFYYIIINDGQFNIFEVCNRRMILPTSQFVYKLAPATMQVFFRQQFYIYIAGLVF